MYSALHKMQWFAHILDVFTPKIKQNFVDFYILWIKTNVAYTRLELITGTKYCTTTTCTASNWFVTLYYKLLPAVRSSSKHGRRRSSLLLYSISMVHAHTQKRGVYTSRFLLTGYVGLTLRSTAVATASRSTVEGTMWVLSSYCMRSSLSHPDSSWPATWVSHYAVLLWLQQVEVELRVLCGYSAATACAVASKPFVTVTLEYPQRYCDLQ